jgi:hypothetical protein
MRTTSHKCPPGLPTLTISETAAERTGAASTLRAGWKALLRWRLVALEAVEDFRAKAMALDVD